MIISKKTLLLLLASLSLLPVMKVKAQDTLLDLGGGFTLKIPFKEVSVIQMYSFKDEHGFTGAETTLLESGKLRLNLGGATGYKDGKQFPFVSLHTKLSDKFFDTANNDLRFGVYLGRDFDAKRNIYGIVCSVPVW